MPNKPIPMPYTAPNYQQSQGFKKRLFSQCDSRGLWLKAQATTGLLTIPLECHIFDSRFDPRDRTFHLEVSSGYTSSLVQFQWEHTIGWRLTHMQSGQARGMCIQEIWWAVHAWAVDVSNMICLAANYLRDDFDQSHVKIPSGITMEYPE